MADELKDEPVGKGNPPKSTQFAKGKSGNPKGRRKGKSNKRTIVQKVALEEHTVIENGQRKKLTLVDQLLKVLQFRAVSGDLPAKKHLDMTREKYQPDEVGHTGGILVCPPQMGLEEFLRYAAAQRERMLWAQADRHNWR